MRDGRPVASTPAARSAVMLRGGVAGAVLPVLPLTLAAAVLDGVHAAPAVLAGAVLGAAALALVPLALRLAGTRSDAALGGIVAGTYVGTLAVAGVGAAALTAGSQLALPWVGAGLGAGIVGWLAGMVGAVARMRSPVFDAGESPAGGTTSQRW